MSCLICERIKLIKEGKNPYFVIELETGYVVLGDHQRFKGYTLFLCKEHVTELHHLPNNFKIMYRSGVCDLDVTPTLIILDISATFPL